MILSNASILNMGVSQHMQTIIHLYKLGVELVIEVAKHNEKETIARNYVLSDAWERLHAIRPFRQIVGWKCFFFFFHFKWGSYLAISTALQWSLPSQFYFIVKNFCELLPKLYPSSKVVSKPWLTHTLKTPIIMRVYSRPGLRWVHLTWNLWQKIMTKNRVNIYPYPLYRTHWYSGYWSLLYRVNSNTFIVQKSWFQSKLTLFMGKPNDMLGMVRCNGIT